MRASLSWTESKPSRSRRSRRLGLLTALLTALAPAGAQGAPELRVGTVAAAPGAVVDLPLALVEDGTVTALQVDLLHDAGLLTAEAAAAGPALLGGDHEVHSHVVGPGRVRVLILSRTNQTMPGGVVATVPLTVSGVAPEGDLPVALEAVELVAASATVVPPSATLAGTVRIGACLGGDVFPDGTGDADSNLADYVSALRAVAAGGEPAARLLQCADLAPGSLACEDAPPFHWCPQPDGAFDAADAQALRALAAGVYRLTCDACLAADLGFRGPIPPGDVTGDGRIDVSDVVRLLRLAVQLEVATETLLLIGDVAPTDPLVGAELDVVGDDLINVSDVVLALRSAVQLTTIRWPERRLVLALAEPASYLAWSATITRIPRWAEPQRLEGVDCVEAVSGLDLADTSWAATCVTDPTLRTNVTGTVGELVYRAPQDLDVADIGLRSDLVDDALAVTVDSLEASTP